MSDQVVYAVREGRRRDRDVPDVRADVKFQMEGRSGEVRWSHSWVSVVRVFVWVMRLCVHVVGLWERTRCQGAGNRRDKPLMSVHVESDVTVPFV